MNDANRFFDGRPSGPNWSRINQWVLWTGLAAAVVWMFYRHNAHLTQLLPFLILLACPLMHLFGHGGHGGGSGSSQDDDNRRAPPDNGHGAHHH